MFISQSYQSFLFLKTFLKDNNCPKDIEIFENQKALYETKLRKFYNFSKHMDEKILEGHHLETGGVALWITSAGLEYKSEETGDIWCFQWEEMKTVLLDLVESAEFILKVHSVPLDSTCQKLAFTPQN
ncbi:hypothetical protein [Vampirovibrio chlorellavorus]|uniref:hypothetical protein n=1 Tax=Vampirovibrio chlorellavorus TaxID=758823 RepID=UPI0026F0FF8D|nr:hypothetical protein [Vampirovibrio chlorellavorus]